jgi:hypothetical protein
MWLTQFVCAPQFFKTPSGLCGHTVQQDVNARKAPGHDLIARRILKTLSRKGNVSLKSIRNLVIRTGHFPAQWEFALIIRL